MFHGDEGEMGGLGIIALRAAAQVFAFQSSLSKGLSPDNPNKAGTVNRVVQGVRIHASTP